MANPTVFFDVSIGGAAAGRITFTVNLSFSWLATTFLHALRLIVLLLLEVMYLYFKVCFCLLVARLSSTSFLGNAALRGRRPQDSRELQVLRVVHKWKAYSLSKNMTQ